MTTDTFSQVPRELAERRVSDMRYAPTLERATRALEAVIREAMQKAQPQWISVSDKLPKIHEAVIVYMPKYSHIDTDCVQVSSLCGHKTFSSEIDCGSDGHVTHWQPLPEPPTQAASSSLTEQETTK